MAFFNIDSFFLISERGSSIAQEVRAGTASFLTLSYLLLVNPQIMTEAGVPHSDALFATAVSAAVSCFILGFGGNLPFGCAPGLGSSAYLAFGLVQAQLCSLSEALTACWWSGVLVLLVCLCGLATFVMNTVPRAIRFAIVVGMGMLIAMIGMLSVGMIVANPKTLVELGDVFGDRTVQLSLGGFLLVGSLMYHDIKGGVLIGMCALTVLDWVLNNTWPEAITEMPRIPQGDYLVDLFVLFDPMKAKVLLTATLAFVLICVFDVSGVMFGLSTLAGLRDENEHIPGAPWAFIATAVGTMVAAAYGSTPIILCVEGASGVREGGRTGLTAIVIGLYFVLSLFLAPLFEAVPNIATAPVLVLVGALMMPESAKIDWSTMDNALPAFLTIVLMPMTYSITNGMIMGIVTSVGFYFTTGRFVVDLQRLRRGPSSLNDNERTHSPLLKEGSQEVTRENYETLP